MLRGKDAGGRTAVQIVNDLIKEFIGSHGVELRFVRNPTTRGRYSPEFDFIFLYPQRDVLGNVIQGTGRRITQRALATLMVTEFAEKNYNISITNIAAGLTAIAWKHYMQTQEYPGWLAEVAPYERRRIGRPRKKPKVMTYNPDVEELAVAEGIHAPVKEITKPTPRSASKMRALKARKERQKEQISAQIEREVRQSLEAINIETK